MTKNKLKTIVCILSCLLAAVIIAIIAVIVTKYNDAPNVISGTSKPRKVEEFVKLYYPDYTIVEKKYEYLNGLWSTWYDTDEDDREKEIICNTVLRNNETGMYISVPFYHPPNRPYQESKYGRKNIREMVKKYEQYWNQINSVAKKYGVETNVSYVKLTEANNIDAVNGVAIYMKYKTSVDYMNNVIAEMEDITTTLMLGDVTFVVAKDDAYERLSPWTEDNYYYITLRMMDKTADQWNFEVFVKSKSYSFVDFYNLKDVFEKY